MPRGRLVRRAGAAALATGAAVLLVAFAFRSEPKGIPKFKHIVLIVLENKSYEEVIGNPSAPEINALADRYALLTKYLALAHPSLPNYLALVSGSTQGVTTDCTDCSFAARTLADTIEAKGRTWKVYAEGLPATGFTGAESGRYAKKHNPLLYFRDVQEQPARLDRIVPLSEFVHDLADGSLPSFAQVVPDLCHTAHDCPLATADAWLNSFLTPLLLSPLLEDGVVFVTFDEGGTGDVAGGGGHIVTLVLGPRVRPGAVSSRSLTHYSLLRTIEDAWHLPRLGASAKAKAIRGIWR